MNNTPRTLTLLPESFAICRLAPDAAIPAWAMPGKASFLAITLTHEELSIICPAHLLPADTDIPAFTGWRCLKLEGPIPLDEPGVLASLVVPMSKAGLSVFAEATYDTDYLLVNHIDTAIQALEQMGHRVVQ
jgi:hypothetical protein